MGSENNEILRITKDPKLYIESFLKIKGKEPGLIPFILNPPQIDFLNTLTHNNRVIILKARQMGFCLEENTRVLTSDLKWKLIKDVLVGDKLVSVDEFPPLHLGNKKTRRIKEAVVEATRSFEDFVIEITMDDGRVLKATEEHRFLSTKNGSKEPAWKKVKELRVGSKIRFITKPWSGDSFEDGWMGGVVDGEGSICKKTRSGSMISISQVDGVVFDRIMSYVKERFYNYRLEVDKREPSDSSKFGSKDVNKVIIGRMNEMFRFLGETRPLRMINKKWWEDKALPGKNTGIGWASVVSIKKIGKRAVVDLQTSTKTFIAEGFVSHNSTLSAAYIYWKTITTPGTSAALISHKAEVSAEFLDKIKLFWRGTPEAIRPALHFNSKYEMSFPGIDSKISVLSGESVGRGFTLHLALCSELAFWPDPEAMMLSIENAVPSSGQVIIESTPCGVGNLFHRMWMSKDNGYSKREYGWHWLYTEKEIEKIRRRISDPLKFAQEYELQFLSSGRQVFNPKLIQKLQLGILNVGDTVVLENKTKHVVFEQEDGLRIYRPPVDDHLYVAGVDVAEGVLGGDFSTCVIFDRISGEEVAFFRGQLAPDKFGIKLNDWGRFYKNALMVVEINNHGLTTVTALKNLLYPQLYFRPAKFDTIGTKWSDRLGWKTTRVTRPLMIDDLNEGFTENSIKPHSKELVDEMLTFIFDAGNNMMCMKGFHDDCIFGAAIGFQGFKVLYDKPLTQLNYEDHLPTSTPY